MIFKPNIKKRVMIVIGQKIEEAQKVHDEKLSIMETKHKEEVEELRQRQAEDTTALTDSVVSGLIKNFIKN